MASAPQTGRFVMASAPHVVMASAPQNNPFVMASAPQTGLSLWLPPRFVMASAPHASLQPAVFIDFFNENHGRSI